MERIKSAENRVYAAEWAVSDARRNIREQEAVLATTAAGRYGIPVTLTILGIAALIFVVPQIVPFAALPAGEDWKALVLIGGLASGLFGIGGFLEARSEYRYAPKFLAKQQAQLVHYESEAESEKANLAAEHREYERRRRLPDAWSAVAGILATDSLRRIESGDFDDDDLIAAELRAVVGEQDEAGWSALENRVGAKRARLLRDAREAIGHVGATSLDR